MAEQHDIPVKALDYPGYSTDKKCCDTHVSPTNSTFPFLKLPKEIQYQIYEWLVGNRTLHVKHTLAMVLPAHQIIARHGHLYWFTCHAKSTQFDVYNSYAKPVSFEDEMGSTLPKENSSFESDVGCRCWLDERARHYIDLPLLTVSRETAREALRLFYSTNTWKFTSVDEFRIWLRVIPPEKLTLVHRLHLVIYINVFMSKPGSNVARWKTALSDQVVAQLPNLKVLHIELYVARFVRRVITSPPFLTFSRQEKGKDLAKLFEPLQKLANLKHCTVVMIDNKSDYYLKHYGAMWHGDEPEWKRKEALRVWAEDIRSLILSR
ncbi:MAG: hypothetical protein Q9195_005379 [Heterodermia aff. obscurata]